MGRSITLSAASLTTMLAILQSIKAGKTDAQILRQLKRRKLTRTDKRWWSALLTDLKRLKRKHPQKRIRLLAVE